MKTIRFFLLVVLSLTMTLAANAQKGNKTIVYDANLHCGSCKAKVEKNIPYEKGVKDLKVDMEKNTITVTFREDKNTAEDIQKAIEKLDIKISGFKDANADVKKEEKTTKAGCGGCPSAKDGCGNR